MVAPIVGRPFTQVFLGEAKRNWPFVVGFGVTFTLILKLSASLDPKEAHKSKFVDPYGHHWYKSSSFYCGNYGFKEQGQVRMASDRYHQLQCEVAGLMYTS